LIKLIEEMAYGLECSGHDLRPVVDRKDDVCYTCLGKCFDLMLNHRLVAKFDKRLWKGESLIEVNVGFMALCAPSQQRGSRRKDRYRTRGRRRVPNPPTRMRAVETPISIVYSHYKNVNLPFIFVVVLGVEKVVRGEKV